MEDLRLCVDLFMWMSFPSSCKVNIFTWHLRLKTFCGMMADFKSIKYCASQITVIGMSSLSMYYTTSLLQLRKLLYFILFFLEIVLYIYDISKI